MRVGGASELECVGVIVIVDSDGVDEHDVEKKTDRQTGGKGTYREDMSRERGKQSESLSILFYYIIFFSVCVVCRNLTSPRLAYKLPIPQS